MNKSTPNKAEVLTVKYMDTSSWSLDKLDSVEVFTNFVISPAEIEVDMGRLYLDLPYALNLLGQLLPFYHLCPGLFDQVQSAVTNLQKFLQDGASIWDIELDEGAQNAAWELWESSAPDDHEEDWMWQ